MAKPFNHIDWTNGDPLKVVEPDLNKKYAGWTSGERPTFQYMNWLFFRIDEWLKYLESITDDITEAITQGKGADLVGFVMGEPNHWDPDVDYVGDALDQLASRVTGVETVLVPIGSILPFYEYDGLEKLIYDTDIWKLCNGSNVLFGDGLNRDLPDASNRYFVGFGTENGQDIGTEAWNTAPIGNAGHLIDLSHSHSVSSHNHGGSTGGSAPGTNGAGAHSHGGRTWGMATSANQVSTNYRLKDDSQGWKNRLDGIHINVDGGSNDEGHHDHDLISDGNHAHTVNSHSHSVGAESPGTDSRLSGTQSIQPRSIRVRYIMRVK